MYQIYNLNQNNQLNNQVQQKAVQVEVSSIGPLEILDSFNLEKERLEKEINLLNFDAATELGSLYLCKGLESKAKYYFSLGANESASNRAYAAHQLCLLLLKEKQCLQPHEYDFEKIFQAFQKAIEWNSKETIDLAYRQGLRFKNGTPRIKPDNSIALRYFEMSAEGGHSDAIMETCKSLLKDYLEKGDSERVNWKQIRKNLDNGLQHSSSFVEEHFNPDEIYALGFMYFHGLGGEVNEEKGILYLQEASRLRSTNATLDLIAYYRREKNKEAILTLENHYRNIEFNAVAERISETGGTLLALSNNLAKINGRFLMYMPDIKEKCEKKITPIVNSLVAQGLMTTPENNDDDNSGLNNLKKYISENGLCTGMVINFIKHLRPIFEKNDNDIDFETQLIKLAKSYEYFRLKNAIFQVMFSILTDIIEMKHPNFSDEENDLAASEPLYAINEQKITPLPEIQYLARAKKNRDYLTSWLTLPDSDGVYEFSIKGSDYSHALTLIKRGKQVYLWDPNFGLSKCSLNAPVDCIQNHLIKFYSKGDQLELWIRRVEELPYQC